jgi:hypothetical protein
MDQSNFSLRQKVFSKYGQKKIPEAFFIGLLIFLSYCAFFTPNFLISIPVAIFPIFIFRLFWIDGEANVIFWGMMMQWLSASTQLLYCNILGITLAERMKQSIFPGELMEYATLLSILGLFFFALGVFIIIRKLPILKISDALTEYSPKKVLTFYAAFSVFKYITSAAIWAFPSVVQFIYFFLYIKWGFFLVAFYTVHKRAPNLKAYLYLIIGVEVILSFSSFFADNFTNIVFYTILGLLTVQPKLDPKAYIFIGIGGVGLLHFMILWTAIKPEYRSYVSKGQNVQSVLVSRTESNTKFFELISNVGDAQYQVGIDKLVDRLGYIQYFGAALEYVPKTVPHQNGAIYWKAIQHYLVPRFLNPDKAVLDDSKHTAEFTGIVVSGADDASSFSLGYIADAYIDFGPLLMFPALLLFGSLFGIFYKFFIRKSPNVFWQWICVGPFFLLININGTDTTKALGWVLIYSLTVALTRKQLIKRLDPLMRK